MEKTMLGVRLSKETEKRLNALSKKSKRSKSFFVKEALNLYLDNFELFYQEIADYEEQKRNGTLQTVSLEKIMRDNKISYDDLES